MSREKRISLQPSIWSSGQNFSATATIDWLKIKEYFIVTIL
jgi:hypothetical protein